MHHISDIELNYMTIDQAAQAWGVTARRVQAMCAGGRLDGALQIGRTWYLPKNMKKPPDGRTKAAKLSKANDLPLPRKTPFLYMSDLYSVPGQADDVTKSLAYHHEAQVLFEAQVAYSRGEINKVYDSANYLLSTHSGFYAVISAGMLLALCAIWKGDLEMWRKAKVHISEAKMHNENDREIITLAICAVDSMLYDVQNFPDWFKIGCFEPLHKDALPAAKVYYAKYLYAVGHGLASGEFELKGINGLALMGLLPTTIEPMISQAKADEAVISEAYLRLTCAVVYHAMGDDKQAVRHIDRALALTLPDRLYGLLAEYCRTIGALIEARLCPIDEAAWSEVSRLFNIYSDGWNKLNNRITGRYIIQNLSPQNREVARLAALRLSDTEIAERMHMSLSGVKQAIKIVKQKSGLERQQFAAIL